MEGGSRKSVLTKKRKYVNIYEQFTKLKISCKNKCPFKEEALHLELDCLHCPRMQEAMNESLKIT